MEASNIKVQDIKRKQSMLYKINSLPKPKMMKTSMQMRPHQRKGESER